MVLQTLHDPRDPRFDFIDGLDVARENWEGLAWLCGVEEGTLSLVRFLYAAKLYVRIMGQMRAMAFKKGNIQRFLGRHGGGDDGNLMSRQSCLFRSPHFGHPSFHQVEGGVCWNGKCSAFRLPSTPQQLLIPAFMVNIYICIHQA
jgi:hypothetical protein